MKKTIIIVGMMVSLGSASQADHHRSVVNIKNADKVIVRSGISEQHVVEMFKCLLKLKKFESVDAAIDDKMAMIKAKCAKHSLSDEKCQKMQMVMAEKIHNCFAKKEFIQEFFKTDKAE